MQLAEAQIKSLGTNYIQFTEQAYLVFSLLR